MTSGDRPKCFAQRSKQTPLLSFPPSLGSAGPGEPWVLPRGVGDGARVQARRGLGLPWLDACSQILFHERKLFLYAFCDQYFALTLNESALQCYNGVCFMTSEWMIH